MFSNKINLHLDLRWNGTDMPSVYQVWNVKYTFDNFCSTKIFMV